MALGGFLPASFRRRRGLIIFAILVAVIVLNALYIPHPPSRSIPSRKTSYVEDYGVRKAEPSAEVPSAVPAAVAPTGDHDQFLRLNMLVIGDWGAENSALVELAAVMQNAANYLGTSLYISTGDNIYPSGVSPATLANVPLPLVLKQYNDTMDRTFTPIELLPGPRADALATVAAAGHGGSTDAATRFLTEPWASATGGDTAAPSHPNVHAARRAVRRVLDRRFVTTFENVFTAAPCDTVLTLHDRKDGHHGGGDEPNTSCYTPRVLHVQRGAASTEVLHAPGWVGCLGNHDRYGSAASQVAYTAGNPAWILPAAHGHIAVIAGCDVFASPRGQAQTATTCPEGRQYAATMGATAWPLGPDAFQAAVTAIRSATGAAVSPAATGQPPLSGFGSAVGDAAVAAAGARAQRVGAIGLHDSSRGGGRTLSGMCRALGGKTSRGVANSLASFAGRIVSTSLRSGTAGAPMLDLFVLDSYGPHARASVSFEEQIRDLQAVMCGSWANRTDSWRVVLSHGPLFSGGSIHGPETGLRQWAAISRRQREQLLPVLRMCNVDIYVNGDDHSAQVHYVGHGMNSGYVFESSEVAAQVRDLAKRSRYTAVRSSLMGQMFFTSGAGAGGARPGAAGRYQKAVWTPTTDAMVQETGAFFAFEVRNMAMNWALVTKHGCEWGGTVHK